MTNSQTEMATARPQCWRMHNFFLWLPCHCKHYSTVYKHVKFSYLVVLVLILVHCQRARWLWPFAMSIWPF